MTTFAHATTRATRYASFSSRPLVLPSVLLSVLLLAGCASWPDTSTPSTPPSASASVQKPNGTRAETGKPTVAQAPAVTAPVATGQASAPAGGAAPVVTLTPAPLPGQASPASAPAATPALPSTATDSGAAVTSPVNLPPGAQAAQDGSDGATTPVDPLRPDVRVNLEDRSARQELWGRIRLGFGVKNLDGELVRKAEKMYASKPDYVQRMNERGGRYLFHIVEEVQRRNMPTEIALLPFVESAFNPEAMSHARASGMWQFMPATGKVFNLTQNVFRDDRRDVLASTRAALDYLGKLHKMFGDWHLALAAYNWGEGSVQRAIAKNKRLGKPTDYESLSMPNETRFYVPKLQAIKNIVSTPQAYGLTLPPLENHPYFLSVGIERDMDMDVAARLSNMPLADFKALNPQLNRPVILAAGTPQILLPYDNANLFINALKKHKGALATWTAWTVPSTMKAADAARQVGMSDEGFRTINHIPPKMLVKAGSTVLVPRAAGRQTDVSGQVADNGSMLLAHESPPLRKITVVVGKKGGSVAAIAKRYGVSSAQVAQWKKVKATGTLAAGTKVLLEVPVKMAKGGKAGKASKMAKAKPNKGSRSAKVANARGAKPAAKKANGAKVAQR
jgi:membrane-bound lytic murein transglycosylase D